MILARAARPFGEVVLEVRVAAADLDRAVERGGGERRPAEVRVDDDPRRVQHPAERGPARRPELVWRSAVRSPGSPPRPDRLARPRRSRPARRRRRADRRSRARARPRTEGRAAPRPERYARRSFVASLSMVNRRWIIAGVRRRGRDRRCRRPRCSSSTATRSPACTCSGSTSAGRAAQRSSRRSAAGARNASPSTPAAAPITCRAAGSSPSTRRRRPARARCRLGRQRSSSRGEPTSRQS